VLQPDGHRPVLRGLPISNPIELARSLVGSVAIIAMIMVLSGCEQGRSRQAATNTTQPAWFTELHNKLGNNFVSPLPQATQPFNSPDGPRDLAGIAVQILAEWDELLKPVGGMQGRRFAVAMVTSNPGADPCGLTQAELKGKVSSCGGSSPGGEQTDYLEVPADAFATVLAALQNSDLAYAAQFNTDVLVAINFSQYITARLGSVVGSIPAMGSAAPEPVYRLAGMSLRAVLPTSTKLADFDRGFRLADQLMNDSSVGSADVQERRRQWLYEGFTRGTLASCVASIH
jgi:hypothetical protein